MKAIVDFRRGRYRLWQAEMPLLSKSERWRRQAESLGLSKQARLKLEWFIYYFEQAGEDASLTCRHFGISRSGFYKWRAVFDPANLKALEEASRAPIHTRQRQLQPLQESRILHLRKTNPEYGKDKLVILYSRHYGEKISAWQCQLVIEKYHLQQRPPKGGRPFKKQGLSKRKTIELKKQQTPGFLVAFDSIVIYHNGLKRYVVTGIDTVSKIAWARMYTTHSSVTTKDLFMRLHAVVHGKVLNTCQDNGSEFEKHFAATLASLNIPQYFSRVKTPKDNPICERFNRTLKGEFLRQGNWTPDAAEFNRRLNLWLLKYNCYRPHQALNYLTPFEYRYQQAELVHDVVI